MIIINVGQYIVWYYLLALGILILTAWGSWRHKNAIPFMWGIILSLILVIFTNQLEPILIGFVNYYNVDWIYFALFGGFAVLWYLYVFLGCYNSVKFGKVVV